MPKSVMSISKNIIIAIDGPVGVGKSTVAKHLARRLGFFHLDTGAMYRTVTLEAMRRGVDLLDRDALRHIASEIKISLFYKNEQLVVMCDERDVSMDIRTPEVSKNTSPVSDAQGVREQMVFQQRSIAKQHKGVVAEGRDMGTVVFPGTPWKFYLDASVEERTRRRLLQLQENRGAETMLSFEEIRSSIIERDRRDRSRAFGPLRVAQDAIVIDTTNISENDVISLIANMVQVEL